MNKQRQKFQIHGKRSAGILILKQQAVQSQLTRKGTIRNTWIHNWRSSVVNYMLCIAPQTYISYTRRSIMSATFALNSYENQFGYNHELQSFYLACKKANLCAVTFVNFCHPAQYLQNISCDSPCVAID